MSEARRVGAWRRAYVFLVLSTVHALLLMLLLELGAQAIFTARENLKPAPIDAETLAAYPQREESEVRQLLAETWSHPWSHQPWVGFRERPRRGHFVNISEQGFRFSAPEERDLDSPGIDVFVFGGSTTFGYGVADLETIPARLQWRLEKEWPPKQDGAIPEDGVVPQDGAVPEDGAIPEDKAEAEYRVFNFGRGYYYSAQELALFQDLLRRGAVPDVAIFLDGLNEGQPAPFFSAEMARLFTASNESPRELTAMGLGALWQRSALNRLVQGAARRLGIDPSNADRGTPSFEGTDATAEQVRDAYLENRRLISAAAEAHGVRAFFFIQPVPGYRNAFADHPLMRHPQSPATAPRMRLLEGTTDGHTSFSLAAALEDFSGRAFVDSFHYSPPVNDLIAQEILEHIEAVTESRAAGKGDADGH